MSCLLINGKEVALQNQEDFSIAVHGNTVIRVKVPWGGTVSVYVDDMGIDDPDWQPLPVQHLYGAGKTGKIDQK